MYNGIINIYKEKGFTSHDVVGKLRGILKQKKIGHTGTLDPDATGVLPVCLGCATKLCDLFTDKIKEYRCTMRLGVKTDTLDMTGDVLKTSDESVVAALTEEEIKEAILSFVGDIDQIPPMYSAIKVDGKKLYELAREGIEIERKARRITIYNIDIEKIEKPLVTFTVKCSKGTYIRTLCDDIGEKLSCYAAMEELVRTQSGDFRIEKAITLSRVEELVNSGEIDEYIINCEDALSMYGKISAKKESDKLLYNGNPLVGEDVIIIEENNEKIYRTYDSEGKFLALYSYDKSKKIYKNEKMFVV